MEREETYSEGETYYDADTGDPIGVVQIWPTLRFEGDIPAAIKDAVKIRFSHYRAARAGIPVEIVGDAFTTWMQNHGGLNAPANKGMLVRYNALLHAVNLDKATQYRAPSLSCGQARRRKTPRGMIRKEVVIKDFYYHVCHYSG